MTRDPGSLTIENLRVSYGTGVVLDGIDLSDIRPGELTALAGPNGAGKSTLLRAIAGLVRAHGKALWKTCDLLEISAEERAKIVGFMPQGMTATNGLSVLEGVLASSRALAPHMPAARHEDLALRTLESVGLLNLATKRLGQLSGGQRQLASLAQSLVRDPEILLLDEPTSALDLRHQIEVMAVLRLIAAGGRIVIMVLHDLNLAANWSDRLVFLHGGQIIRSGPPSESLTPDLIRQIYGVRSSIARTEEGTAHLVIHGLET